MVVERDHAIRHIDMVSGKAFAWKDSFAVKSFQRRMLEKDAGENGAGAVTEEDAVRQRPSLLRVFLDAVLQDIHGDQVGASCASGTVISGHCPSL